MTTVQTSYWPADTSEPVSPKAAFAGGAAAMLGFIALVRRRK